MKKRRSLSRGKSRKMFAKSGSRTHFKNVAPVPAVFRGGIRL